MSVRTLRLVRLVSWIALTGCLGGFTLGCQLQFGSDRPVPLPPGVDPAWVVDRDAPERQTDPLDPEILAQLGRDVQKKYQEKRAEVQKRLEARGEKLPPPKNVLLLSGGGSYGAYPAGVLVGWSQSGLPPEKGGRPVFDVVTGVSTGALIAPLAFLGPEFDDILQREYTTVTNDDIFQRRRLIRSLFAESVATNAPLRQRIDRVVTFENMKRVAEEHTKGRRLYIGTTNLDTKRLVVWDIGAIAAQGTPQARALIVEVMLASAAIPAVFPPSRFQVNIDGAVFEELHVDGAITRGLFFAPPTITRIPDLVEELPTEMSLAGSNMYCLVAGKLYADPEGVRVRTLRIALESISNLLYANTRAELYRLYTYCLLTGMNYWLAAIPPEFPLDYESNSFDPVEMTKLFCEGYRLGREGAAYKPTGRVNPETKEEIRTLEGTAWRDVPPGLRPDEEPLPRATLNQTVKEPQPPTPLPAPPTAPKAPEGTPPVAPQPKPAPPTPRPPAPKSPAKSSDQPVSQQP